MDSHSTAGSYTPSQDSCKVNASVYTSPAPVTDVLNEFSGMLLSSTFLLIYTAMIVPVQICMWNYEDPCNMFPTLYFDVFVDAFFMVQTHLIRKMLLIFLIVTSALFSQILSG